MSLEDKCAKEDHSKYVNEIRVCRKYTGGKKLCKHLGGYNNLVREENKRGMYRSTRFYARCYKEE